MNTPNVHSGQRVITTQGVVMTVAFVQAGRVYAYSPCGIPEQIKVRYDALGGDSGSARETDQLAA
jgi:hypothetical protein